ncbi:MAG: hypothetical protein HY926_10200 [Elusimicrobia bacterium]|nr:hypothetical protein [Elusimicrobiota bacterium]
MRTLPWMLSALLCLSAAPAAAAEGKPFGKGGGMKDRIAYSLDQEIVVKMPEEVKTVLRDISLAGRPVGSIGGKEIRGLGDMIKTPADVITAVTAEGQVTEAMVSGEMKKFLVKLGAEPVGETGYSFRGFLLVKKEGFWTKPGPLTITVKGKDAPFVFEVYPMKKKTMDPKMTEGKMGGEKAKEKSLEKAQPVKE